ncbi:MAG: hypothetical protein AAGE99_02320 [Chlamydiota bacterium]
MKGSSKQFGARWRVEKERFGNNYFDPQEQRFLDVALDDYVKVGQRIDEKGAIVEPL